MTERALPTGWAWTTLGELGQWYGGGTPSKRNPGFWESGTIPWLSPKDMGMSLLVDTQDHITEAAVAGSATSLVPANSVALVVRSGILERTVPISLVPFVTTLNQDMKAVAPHAAINPRWLLYMLQSQEQAILHDCRKAGTTVASLDTAKLHGVAIPLPPLPEQHRIVEALEDHLSRVDAAEQSLSTAKQRLSPLRKSAIQIALDQELDGEEGHSAAERLERILADRVALASKRRAKPANPAYELDLPTGWVTASVDQLCWDIQYGTSSKTGELRDGSDVPVLRMGNIQDGDIDPRNLKYLPTDDPSIDGLLLEAGDLLFNRTNSAELVGKTAVFSDQLEQATFASYLIRCRPVPGVNAQWISHIANSPIGRRYITSVMSQQVGQANVNGTKLAAMPIPIAPQDVEARILDEISETRSSSARLGDSVEVAKARSAALRRSLLRAAFNGELVDQDPTDEPADVALAKIRDQQSRTAPRRRRKVVAAK
ncbi:restriction endonuclease subunit S [Rhodococcus sp. NPDC058532]|uniref:restriction endonuclease subunit S n=1 Tax=Rhodococcus sp. NPDC058532 TaxID=3346540 RepID=UPI0036685E5A